MHDPAHLNENNSPFHRGEQFIQQKFGVREKMERFGQQVVRDFMPEQHREFFAQLPFVFVAHADQQGWPWASMLFKQPGFMNSRKNKNLQINTLPVYGDPLAAALVVGNHIGLLGIELETRRRNRISGQISQVSEHGVELSIKQAFGNCPQYIQRRELYQIDPASMPAATTEKFTRFDQQAIELIRTSDTFFVASFVANGSNAASEGADVSHRGGKPGFVRVDDKQSLTIPDYLGNFHFNTLGNFLENPKAGLLFIDFEHGHMLSLTGSVEIHWDAPDTKFFSGAERLWSFRLDHGFWLHNVLPLRWLLQDYSPNTALTGSWTEAQAAKKAETLKNTWQPYKVTKIVVESSVIKSFYLQPPAGQKPDFQAGQFLTLQADIDGKEQIRTYTVSNAPGDTQIRISVKHEQGNVDKPKGVFSSYMHQHMTVGDIINAKAPSGSFHSQTNSQHPMLLIAAGVGITPMIAMVRHALHQGIRTRFMQEITVICSARNAEQRAFYTELNELASNSKGFIRVFWLLSQPEEKLHLGVDYYHAGRLTRQLLQSLIPDKEVDVYLCGPNSFMQDQYDSLRQLGISNTKIYAEAFGPAALIRDDPTTTSLSTQLPVAETAILYFSEARIELLWSKSDGTILDFAEAHGLAPEYGCRHGQCGTCKVKLLAGKIAYQQEISAPIADSDILICCAVPAASEEYTQNRLEIQL